ncbi:RNA polymerase sigma factor [bacterium]|nr:RNA polymerase sigma factor [bacterium]
MKMKETAMQMPGDLIRKAQQGDPDAFQELVRLHDRKVMGLACRMLGNIQDAEDVYQEVFMRVYSNIRNFQHKSSFETWLYRIVVNTVINFRRSSKRHRGFTSISDQFEKTAAWSPMDEKPLPDEIVMNQEILKNIHDALDRLTMIQRTVFTLRFYQEFKINEIADILECTEGTIKNTLFRSIRKMRQALSVYQTE